MDEELSVRTEAIGDIPVLIGIIRELKIAEVIDSCVKVDGHWQGISVGTVVSLWLCYVLSTQDHRLVAVRDWVAERRETFNQLLGIQLRETDCSDDRLAIVLTLLGEVATQMGIEDKLMKDWISIYALPHETIRLDSTTVQVYHDRDEEADSVLQFGFSHEGRDGLRQFKVMMATLDPLGMPLTSTVLSGEQGDDQHYIPCYQRAIAVLGTADVLVVGDSKMSSLAARGQIVAGKSRYLCPLNENSLNEETRFGWADEAVAHPERWQEVYRQKADGEPGELLAVLVEYERAQQWTDAKGDLVAWTERIVLFRSVPFQAAVYRHVERRWQHLQTQLDKLAQSPRRGQRYYWSYEALWKTVQDFVKAADLEEVVEVDLGQQPLPNGRARWIVESYRLHPERWAIYCARLGWRAYATTSTPAQVDGPALLGLYRHQVLHERTFSRLKTRRLNIQPIFLRDEQRISGLVWLLDIALRILTLTEFRVRQALHETSERLVGLNPAAPSQATVRPTTDRLLAAFSTLHLSIIHLEGQVRRYVPPLTALQQRILALLALPDYLYAALATAPP